MVLKIKLYVIAKIILVSLQIKSSFCIIFLFFYFVNFYLLLKKIWQASTSEHGQIHDWGKIIKNIFLGVLLTWKKKDTELYIDAMPLLEWAPKSINYYFWEFYKY